ncbi:hypothetical protein JHK85_052838 [Glycine max]|nr:hypothetical protein JHK86_051980 [Glycine max]KAG4926352.1 hypothetical protein JHK85_052838 [Glycine max]
MALQFISNGVVPTHPYYLIVHKIHCFMLLDWQLWFTYTLQEANSCATGLQRKMLQRITMVACLWSMLLRAGISRMLA